MTTRVLPWSGVASLIEEVTTNGPDNYTPCQREVVASVPENVAMRGDHIADEIVTCWGCLNQWCDRCDPAPAALCPFCHGGGELAYPLD